MIRNMKKIAIIGGGASGLACAVHLKRAGADVTLFERGERLGRKLSATGNGQGNVTNLDMGASHYFSDDQDKVARALSRFGVTDTVRFLEGLGGVFLPDSRGRVYPASRQASQVTDLFRRALKAYNTDVCFKAQVNKVAYDGKYTLKWDGGQMCADAVVLAAGGMAAPSFGTDGNGYALAESLGHTVTKLTPALVQLRCAPDAVRGLKGIRTDAALTLVRNGVCVFSGRGDILFTESGISGDLAFRASSYAERGDEILLDLVPDADEGRLTAAAEKGEGEGALLCVVHGALARFLARRANGDRQRLVSLVKRFPLTVTGTLGFQYAQVTKGGVPLKEVDDNFMSKKREGLYLLGELLNADGECGGYNLQWAFTTAFCAAEGLK